MSRSICKKPSKGQDQTQATQDPVELSARVEDEAEADADQGSRQSDDRTTPPSSTPQARISTLAHSSDNSAAPQEDTLNLATTPPPTTQLVMFSTPTTSSNISAPTQGSPDPEPISNRSSGTGTSGSIHMGTIGSAQGRAQTQAVVGLGTTGVKTAENEEERVS